MTKVFNRQLGLAEIETYMTQRAADIDADLRAQRADEFEAWLQREHGIGRRLRRYSRVWWNHLFG